MLPIITTILFIAYLLFITYHFYQAKRKSHGSLFSKEINRVYLKKSLGATALLSITMFSIFLLNYLLSKK